MTTPLLVSTAGASDANTYATMEEAEAYFDTQLYRDNWEESYDDQKKRALLMATRLLDEHVDWNGVKATDEQALRWPQDNQYDVDGYWVDNATIPLFLKNATAELAGHLIGSNRTAESDTKGFKEMQAGELKLVINPGDRYEVIPESVIAIIGFYGTLLNASEVKVLRV